MRTVGVGQRVVKGGLEVFIPGAFGLLIHAFLSLCIREISGGCSVMTGDQAFCRPLLPPACHHTAMQPRDQCRLRTVSLVYLVQICSSIRKHISCHIYLQLSGCVVIAERHAGSNKVFSLHDFRWTHILITSYRLLTICNSAPGSVYRWSNEIAAVLV